MELGFLRTALWVLCLFLFFFVTLARVRPPREANFLGFFICILGELAARQTLEFSHVFLVLSCRFTNGTKITPRNLKFPEKPVSLAANQILFYYRFYRAHIVQNVFL